MNKKTNIFLSLLAVLTTCLISCDGDHYTIGDWEYIYNHDAYQLFKYIGTNEELKVMNNVEDYEMTYIGSNAFDNNVKHLEIQDDIAASQSAFATAKHLETLDYSGEQVMADNMYDLSEMCNLTTAIFGGDFSTIPSYVFYDCLSLRHLSINANIKTIESNAFSGCYSLKYFTIPNTIETIYSEAFNNCGDLTLYIEDESLNDLTQALINDSGCKYVLGKGIYNDLVYEIHDNKIIINDFLGELNRIIIPSHIRNMRVTTLDLPHLSQSGLVYYEGSIEEFEKVDVVIPGFSTLCFSKEKPSKNTNAYWHYVKGVPTRWEEA